MTAMADRLALSALLSQALVAFTIEFDNEFERRTPHQTTDHGSTLGSNHAPWLVSMVMWEKFLQFVPDNGITIRELQRLTGLSDKGMVTWLTRLGKWWGYIVIGPDQADPPAKSARSEWQVRPTPGGQKALEVWRPLSAVIEQRWDERFGPREIEHLRESLRAVVSQLDPELPDSLPILGYGLFSKADDDGRRSAATRGPHRWSHAPLPALLSRPLLAFAVDFEGESELSLAIGANVLRLAGEEGVRIRDLPRLAGVSREAIATALSFLEKRGYASVKQESSGKRAKLLMLNARGLRARDEYHRLVWNIEERWQARFGKKAMAGIRDALEQLVGQPAAEHSPLFRGLEPYPDGWRASVPRPDTLPHYPMVLHRGGFPDGC
jgi:DNA-binding MarR family transcriptional regulator